MPVYLFTFHAYRSWMPDHPRGYTKRNQGVLEPDPEMRENYERRARFDPVEFNDEHARVIAGAIQSECSKRDVRLHYLVTVATHTHPLVSWKNQQFDPNDVYARLKQSAGFALAKHFNTNGRPYFSRGGGDDRKQVVNDDHFEHLMTTYLPDHHGYTINERKSRAL